MFNIQGSELVFLLLIALLVLGPEKLPDAIRKFTRTYAEFKKVAGGFQGELRQALDEPMRELRGTAEALRQAASFDPEAAVADSAPEPATESASENDGVRPEPMVSEIAPRTGPAEKREATLNFGNPAERRARAAEAAEAAPEPTATPDPEAGEGASE